MRWVLVVAFCIAAGAATWTGFEDGQSGLRVTIGYALPESDSEDNLNELGDRYWGIYPPVTVKSERRCDRAELTTGGASLFNGEPGFSAQQEELGYGDLAGDGQTFKGRAESPTALPGETVRITATVRCISGDSVSTATARREFELPAASCDQGPLRVGEIEGRVTAVDWNHEEQGERALEPGFLITPASEFRVETGGQVEIAAPECNGFRVTLREGLHDVGSYSRARRGESFSAKRAEVEGDSHAGGILVPGMATVWPAVSSSYEVRSTPKRVTVRVIIGAALVGGPDERPILLVPAGHQASVLCSAGKCRAGHVRLFQEDEPWSTPPEGVVDELPRSAEGDTPPLRALAPTFSHVQAKRLPAAGEEPDQIILAWSRKVRRKDDSYPGYTDEQEQGFLGWQRVAPKRWELVYERPVACCPAMGIELGDLTREGHLDALTREAQGTGACGFTRVLLSSGGRLREEFARYGCDDSLTIENGDVVLKHGVGPCPWDVGGAHCSGGTRTVVKRWNGSELVNASERIKCHDPKLDPAQSCRPKTERD